MPRKKTAPSCKRLKQKYGNSYDYSKIVYKNARTPIILICKVHGEFASTPDTLLSKRRKRTACPKCSIMMSSHDKKMSIKEFIKKAKSKIKQQLDYSKVKFNKSNEKVAIICPFHGEFYIRASVFLYKGKGCKYCIIENKNNSKRLSRDEFETRVLSKHGKKYQI